MKKRFLVILSISVLTLCFCTTQQEEPKDIVRTNIMLASQGKLASKAFFYPQSGVTGLFPEWIKDRESSTNCSDLYFEAGLIASSRWMAFEAVIASESFNEEMTKRLVQTNIIFGDYPIAAKYLRALKKNGCDRKWVEDQSEFLWNDELVLKDSLYRLKRACIPLIDEFVGWKSPSEDLLSVIRNCPEHKSSLEILGMKYLLAGELNEFSSLMKEFYGTAALPELPQHFKEAVCIIGDYEKGLRKELGVPMELYRAYHSFLEDAEKGVYPESVKNTYWWYYHNLNRL